MSNELIGRKLSNGTLVDTIENMSDSGAIIINGKYALSMGNYSRVKSGLISLEDIPMDKFKQVVLDYKLVQEIGE